MKYLKNILHQIKIYRLKFKLHQFITEHVNVIVNFYCLQMTLDCYDFVQSIVANDAYRKHF